MYLNHWRLDRSPFLPGQDPRESYPSASFEEAVARVEYLVSERRRLGVLLGERGLGKSTTLRAVAARLARSGASVAVVDAVGLTSREFCWHIACQLGAAPSMSADMPRLWRTVVDRLAEQRWQGRPTALLVDDANQLAPDVVQQLTRLANIESGPDSQWSIVLTLAPQHLQRLSATILHLIDLRVDLYPWDLNDTIGYLQHSLVEAGRLEPAFADDALRLIHDLTGGVPRAVVRLADFALLAGAGAGADVVDASLVHGAFDEISWAPAMALE